MPDTTSRYVDIRAVDLIPDVWDGFRVGSESCSQLLPSADIVRKASEQIDPGCLSLVTPIAASDEIDNMMDLVKAAVLSGWGEVVVNDWGVLSELEGTEGVVVTAGRLLMRFRRGPGTFDPWHELDPATRRYFAWGPLYDSPFLAFLRGKGVDRIELDLPRHWLELPELEGFKFSLHQSTRFISVSAACPWLYNEEKGNWSPMDGCGRRCAGQSDIKMTSPALKGSLFLRGRAFLERVNTDINELDLPESVDRIIYDGIMD